MVEKLKIIKSEMEGIYVIRPFSSNDERGWLIKDYNLCEFKKYGIKYELKETFYTISHKGVIRAIHFQLIRPQPKLVRCIKGSIWAAVVDLRKNSNNFGKWIHYDLNEQNRLELLIPAGFGWGYLVLTEAIVSYKCAETFFSEGDSGILYNDPDIAIDWPIERIGGISKLIISEKDKNLMTLKEYTEMQNI